MNSLWKLFCILLIVAAGLSACSAQPEGASAPKLKVGFNPDVPPFASLDARNSLTGLDIDLAQAILGKAGLNYELINVGPNLNALLDTCQISLGISAIPIAENLKAQMLLSEPYYTTGHSVVTKKGNLLISGADQLAGAVVGAQAASVSEQEIASIQGAKAKPYATYSGAFQDLANGYIDAALVDTPRAQNFVEIKRYNLKIAGSAFGTVQYGIGVCKKDQNLLTQVNEALAALKGDGSLERIISRWGLK